VSDLIASGETLSPGDRRSSPQGQYELVMQDDGNLVLYNLVPIWASDTIAPNTRAVMQSDGNFVVYSGEQSIWATGTEGHPRAEVKVQDDGNLVLYWTQPLWASKG
jgi:hypothetical protein